MLTIVQGQITSETDFLRYPVKLWYIKWNLLVLNFDYMLFRLQKLVVDAGMRSFFINVMMIKNV